MTDFITLIITHNQRKSIEYFLPQLGSSDRLWVVDRSIDETEHTLTRLNERFIKNNEGSGFLAGKMRDLGLDDILSRDVYKEILFLDGDRIPNTSVINIMTEHRLSNADCSILFCENDIRKKRLKLGFPVNYLVYTMGIVVNVKTLKEIRTVSEMEGRCFHRLFDGEYGMEDILFGELLKKLNKKIVISPFTVSGSMPNKNPTRITYTQRVKFMQLCQRMKIKPITKYISR